MFCMRLLKVILECVRSKDETEEANQSGFC